MRKKKKKKISKYEPLGKYHGSLNLANNNNQEFKTKSKIQRIS